MLTYFDNIIYGICAFGFAILMGFAYFTKYKISKPNIRYILALIIIVIICIFTFILPYTIPLYGKESLINIIIGRFYCAAQYLFAIELFLIVLMAISPVKKPFNGNRKYYAIFTISSIILFGLAAIFAPIEFVGGADKPYNVAGAILTISQVTLAITNTIEFILIMKYKKNISQLKYSYIPLAILLLSYITALVLRNIYDEPFMICQYFFTCLIAIAYFTFENQDAQFLEKISEKNIEIENISNQKNQFLSYFSKKVRSELSIIVGYNIVLKNKTDYSDEYYINAAENIKDASNKLNSIYSYVNDYNLINENKIKLTESNYELSDLICYLDYIYSKNNISIRYNVNSPKTLIGNIKELSKIVTYLTYVVLNNNKNKTIITFNTESEADYATLMISIKTINTIIDNNIFNKSINLENIDFDDKNIDLSIGISKKLIELLNGRLDYSDENGTEFIISINQRVVNPLQIGELGLKHEYKKGDEEL